MKFIFQSSPEVTIATHKFINVPVVLQYEDTPLMEIIRHQDIGFTARIPIYHSDGTYLAKVAGNRVYPTEAGLKANIEIRNPQGKVICSLDNKVMFRTVTRYRRYLQSRGGALHAGRMLCKMYGRSQTRALRFVGFVGKRDPSVWSSEERTHD